MSFERLVRFVSTDNKIYSGEAIVPSLVLPEQFDAREHAKEAYVIIGNIFDNYTITSIIKPIRKLLCPISADCIGTVRLLGLNYAKHARELNTPLPQYPVIFNKPLTAITGPVSEIIVPKLAQVLENPSSTAPRVDYETELVIVIGKAGRDIPKEKVFDYILGYSVGNDVSQRTWQIARGGSQFITGKMFDTWAPIGPAVVSPSVVGDPNDLGIKSIVNGETRQDSTTNDMIFNVIQTVHFLSQGTTLLPGDIIFTGTPSGVAAGMKEPKWLQNNDVCICKIDKIGSIENKVLFERNGFRDFKL